MRVSHMVCAKRLEKHFLGCKPVKGLTEGNTQIEDHDMIVTTDDD